MRGAIRGFFPDRQIFKPSLVSEVQGSPSGGTVPSAAYSQQIRY